jgi:hypothetical protein
VEADATEEATLLAKDDELFTELATDEEDIEEPVAQAPKLLHAFVHAQPVPGA